MPGILPVASVSPTLSIDELVIAATSAVVSRNSSGTSARQVTNGRRVFGILKPPSPSGSYDGQPGYDANAYVLPS
jgi:hypothetical protein